MCKTAKYHFICWIFILCWCGASENSFHITPKSLISRDVFVCENASIFLSSPKNRILIFNGTWTFVQMSRIFDMQLHEILYNAKYCVIVRGDIRCFPIKPSHYLKSNLNGVNMASIRKVFSYLSKDEDNKNSYFAHMNNIMRFSPSEMSNSSSWILHWHSMWWHRVCIRYRSPVFSCFIIQNYDFNIRSIRRQRNFLVLAVRLFSWIIDVFQRKYTKKTFLRSNISIAGHKPLINCNKTLNYNFRESFMIFKMYVRSFCYSHSSATCTQISWIFCFNQTCNFLAVTQRNK